MARFLPAVVTCGLVFAAAGCGPTRGSGDDDDVRDDARVIDARPIDGPPEIDAPPPPPPIPPDCFAAAERGLAWLVPNQQADGSYGTALKTATTAFAVLKLQTYAAELGLSPFDAAFVYRNQVVAGLDYLFQRAMQVPLAMQTHGNPDSNGNGVGLVFSISGEVIYEQSVVVMAIAAGGEPDRIVTTPGTAVTGRTYRAVVADAVDYLAMAQSDAVTSTPNGCARGGWRYGAFDQSSQIGDNSVTQWVTLALEYARHPLYNYEIALPAWLTTEVREWVTCIQNRSGGFDDGGAGYTSGTVWVNAYKTGAVIQQAAFLGDLPDTANVVAALGYLQRVWAIAGTGWRGNPTSDYLAMYSIMKGMESMAIDHLGVIDWYREFCDQLKLEQLPDGSWPSSGWERERVGASGMQSTLWALLVLEKAAPPPEIIP